MTSDHKTIAATAAKGTDLSNVLGEWLDPFAGDAAQSATLDAAEVEENDFAFSEWCVLPVAALFIIGDMALTFLRG